MYDKLHGLLPLKPEYEDTFDDVILNGKIVFYSAGFIFQDLKINSIVVPYDHISEMTFYNTTEWWLEIKT